jgi:hypothetical protein
MKPMAGYKNMYIFQTMGIQRIFQQTGQMGP